MQLNDVLLDGFSRIQEIVHDTVEGLSEDDLAFRPDKDANSIGWLVWHLTRIQDDHLADLAGTGQVWTDEGWMDKFGLLFDESDTGYGHGSKDVAAVRAGADLLQDYYDAVHAQTVAYISKLTAEDYEKIVDKRWNPPVTQAVRLISVLSDDLQHAGQAAYVRGLLNR